VLIALMEPADHVCMCVCVCARACVLAGMYACERVHNGQS